MMSFDQNLFHDQNIFHTSDVFHKSLSIYKINLYMLCFVYICVVIFSKSTAICRPMFWILTLAIVTNEYSEYLSLQDMYTFSKAMVDTTSRLSFSVFIMGLFYSMFEKIRCYLSQTHTRIVLYTLLLIKFIIMNVECIKLFYHFSALSCNWITPLSIWTGASVIFFLFLGNILIHVKTCKQWLYHKLSWCFIALWGLCTFYTYTYFTEKCDIVVWCSPLSSSSIIQPSYTINFFSWFILFAYVLWDRTVTVK
jgi:hypothetical protein